MRACVPSIIDFAVDGDGCSAEPTAAGHDSGEEELQQQEEEEEEAGAAPDACADSDACIGEEGEREAQFSDGPSELPTRPADPRRAALKAERKAAKKQVCVVLPATE